jgi:spoIIIJ-associated protein
MRDRVFSGSDIEEAVALAAAALGLPRPEVRYVVLEAGSAGGRGLKPTPARIAVLVEEEPRPGGAAPRGGEGVRPREDEAGREPQDPRAGILATMRELARAGDLDVDTALEEGEEIVTVRLRGRDVGFFLGQDGRGAPLHAAEHLLQRLYGEALRPRALRLTGDGFRERLDEALGEDARALAAAVRGDGQPREFPPQNAYERRVVHLALQGEPGVVTFSVGEGSSRRVTIAPAGGPEGRDGGE